MFKRLKKRLNNFAKHFNSTQENFIFHQNYRVIEVVQTEENVFIVTVQVIQKNIVFKIKPEEILANNAMVDLFSPRDIRTLTYLGYLGINAPQYKILAQRLSENNETIVFALKEKGNKNLVLKTAAEIMKEKDILNSLAPKDAHSIGYTLANENLNYENKLKKNII